MVIFFSFFFSFTSIFSALHAGQKKKLFFFVLVFPEDNKIGFEAHTSCLKINEK